MRSDSPSSEWYEPRDIADDDDEPEPWPSEPFVIAHGAGSWSRIDDDDE